jgi:hypothetical protein
MSKKSNGKRQESLASARGSGAGRTVKLPRGCAKALQKMVATHYTTAKLWTDKNSDDWSLHAAGEELNRVLRSRQQNDELCDRAVENQKP